MKNFENNIPHIDRFPQNMKNKKKGYVLGVIIKYYNYFSRLEFPSYTCIEHNKTQTPKQTHSHRRAQEEWNLQSEIHNMAWQSCEFYDSSEKYF